MQKNKTQVLKCFCFLFTGCKVNVVKPQQNKLWLLEIITIQNTISDTIDLENNAYVRKKLMSFYKKFGFDKSK